MVKLKISMPCIEDVRHLQLPLRDISLATNGFARENIIGAGGFGPVYKGVSEKHGRIAVKRLVRRQNQGQGDQEFRTEILLLSKYKHENIVSFFGFCDEDGEKILVYKYESNGSLDKHLNNQDLTWIQRLWICLDAAHGLKHLHDKLGSQDGIFHRDVKSANILLDEIWKAKISDLGLSKLRPANTQDSFLYSNPCGTKGYVDPDYCNHGYLTQKSDVYSFGVVLFEVLCARLAYVPSYNDDRQKLTVWVEKHYIRDKLDKIIPSYLQKQMNEDSLRTFSKIAYQCLKNREERPTMKEEVRKPKKKEKPAASDGKKESKNRPPQEFVFGEGAEDVVTNCKIRKVVMKGEKADPLKFEEKVKTESHEKVKPQKLEQGEKKKDDEKVNQPKGKKEEVETRPPRPQEFVLSVFLHCEGCALKIRRCLKGFEGVEKVLTDCKTDKVVVKGKNADPLKVLERVQNRIGRNVELLSPEPKPQAEDGKRQEQEEPPKQEDYKHEQPPSITVVLEVSMNCEACARKIKKCILNMKGVESAVTDVYNSQVVVKGTFSAPELVDHVHKETGKSTVIVKQHPI